MTRLMEMQSLFMDKSVATLPRDNGLLAIKGRPKYEKGFN